MINILNQTRKFSGLRKQAEDCLQKSRKNKNFPKTRSNVETMQLLHELQVHQVELELQNQELQESRAQLEMALAHYTDLYDFAIAGYFTFDCEGLIIQTNLMGAAFLGMERSRVIGKYFASFILEDACAIFNDFIKRVFKTQKSQSCEVTLSKINHSTRIVQIEATIFNKGKECRAVVHDITERKQKEKLDRLHQLELTQVARVKSMGKIANTIANEINQPLTVIVKYVNGCMRRLESNNYKVSEILEIMRLTSKQVELAGQIMHHMKNVVSQDEAYYKLVSINDIARAAASQIQEEMDNALCVPLKLDLANNLPQIKVDHLQIELVILNLLRNGLESISKVKRAKPKLILRTQRQENMVMISVIDNGPHYTKEEEIHLFDPSFNTLKNGIGMGLSISRTIVEAHLGHLSAYKMPVLGVCFQFSLPLA
jgi:two-component system, LuxR family, sensor kinase FixL